MNALLDVNVLVALAWPNHSQHAAAHRWFGDWNGGWAATTPMTETGFVRLSSNTKVIATAARPVDALAVLRQLRAVPGHVFWIDEVEGAVGDRLDPERILGHDQVSYAHLIAIAMSNDGTVATFDQGLPSLVGRTDKGYVTLIPNATEPASTPSGLHLHT